MVNGTNIVIKQDAANSAQGEVQSYQSSQVPAKAKHLTSASTGPGLKQHLVLAPAREVVFKAQQEDSDHPTLQQRRLVKKRQQQRLRRNAFSTLDFPRQSSQNSVDTHGQQEPLMSCLLYTSPSPRDGLLSRMPSSA